MKIKLQKTPEKVELLKAIASTNRQTSLEAQEALAAIIGPVISQVLPVAASSALVFNDFEFDQDAQPSLPLDLFEGVGKNYIRVWSQAIAGGMPTSVQHGLGEYRFTTYRLDSAISFLNRYAKDARLDVVAKGIERMIQELLLKQEDNAFATLLKAAADGVDAAGDPHTLAATTAGVFQLHDLNKLITKITRVHSAWNGGTPTAVNRRGLTDLLVSPEIVQDIRSFAYQPMNTRSGATTSSGATSIALPDAARMQYFDTAGVPNIFGKNIHQLLELGKTQVYNTLFDTLYSGTPTFDGATQDLVVGLDLSVEAFLRPVAMQPTSDIDVTSQAVTRVDDQFSSRQEQFGFYTRLEEGRLVLDNKAIYCLFV